MKQVLVTGGTGFVGSHLVEALVAENIDVIVIDNNSNGSIENLEKVFDKIKFFQHDITNSDWTKLDEFNPDTIFHLATHPRSFSLQDPKKNAEVNVIGTINLFEYAKKHNSRVVYTSNSGICGDPKFFPVTEDHPIDCKTPYDANKLLGEYYAKIYNKIFGLYTICFRLATVYGEKQKVNKKFGWMPLIPSLVEKILNNEKPVIQWDGEQTRDLIYVKDVVDCLIKGAKSEGLGGEMFLLSTNQETSVKKTLEIILDILQKEIEPIYEEKNQGDLKRMVLSYDKAKKLLDYSPQFSLREGITRYIDWYKSQI